MLARRPHTVLHERIPPPLVLWRYVIVATKPFDAAAEAHRKCTGVKARNRSDAADALENIAPGAVNGATDGRDNPESGDDYASLGQAFTSSMGWLGEVASAAAFRGAAQRAAAQVALRA